jgi:hypothetical protein
MSQVQSAALTLAGAAALLLIAAFAVWWLRRPRAETVPRMPLTPKFPGLGRKVREDEPPVEIAPSRLARISAKPPLDYPSEIEPAPPPTVSDEPEAAPPPAEAPSIEERLDAMATAVERQAAAPRADTDRGIRLVPHIPPRDAIHVRSWLGGRPRLPETIEWPRVDGVHADFLAQIACADLPPDLWDGLGPRSGTLAFFSHPDSGGALALHLADDGPPREPAHGVGDAHFGPYGGLRFGDLAALAVRAFPEWPVDLVPGGANDDEPGFAGAADPLTDREYDIGDPAFHPFDWDSMLAMAAVLERRLKRLAIDTDAPADASDELALALADAAETNREAAAGATEIVRIIRDSAGEHAFTTADATAVLAALHAIRWVHVQHSPDPETGEHRVEVIALPLTRHHPDAPLWVHDYLALLFDHAKHAWCADPDRLSAPARAWFEPLWRGLAAREAAMMGHIPSRYLPDFDDERDVVLLELPTSGLMSRIVGDGDSLILMLRKADLAAGDFSRLRTQRAR